MPELPEVETIRRELEGTVTGRRITSFELFWPKTLRGIGPDVFSALICGQRITGLHRRGKYLIFELCSGQRFSFHLKMTGSLLAAKLDSPPPYTRALIGLDSGVSLFFTDPRKFGRIDVVGQKNSHLDRLGPEPLEPGFTPEILAAVLSGRKTPVKSVLLNQELIAGIGNMYADEALFLARIHPGRPSLTLTGPETARLHASIQSVLNSAIDRKGATVSNYTRPGGEPGRAQEAFNVAHGRGKNCPECSQPVERILVGQRGTYFCPSCQPESYSSRRKGGYSSRIRPA